VDEYELSRLIVDGLGRSSTVIALIVLSAWCRSAIVNRSSPDKCRAETGVVFVLITGGWCSVRPPPAGMSRPYRQRVPSGG
jgi:hypothetical protein